MVLPKGFLPLLGISSLVAGAALDVIQDPILPWQIARLATFSPSGRPGSSPWSQINFTIVDSKMILAGPTPTGTAVFEPVAAGCSTQWRTYDYETPFDNVVNCRDITHGYFTFEMLSDGVETPSPMNNFDVRFTQVREVLTPGGNYTQIWVGKAAFRISEAGNMEGICGASGVCIFGLKDDKAPVLVSQTRIECEGLCD